MIRWLVAFAITQVVETPIYALALRRRRGLAVAVLAGFGASAITHPFLWNGVLPLMDRLTPHVSHPYLVAVAIGETLVVLVEAAYLHLLGARPALAWAALANGASIVAGVLAGWLGWLG